MIVGLRLVAVGRDRRHGADQRDRALQALLDRQIVHRLVLGLVLERHREENGARDAVHDVHRRMTQDRVLLETVRQLAVRAELVLPVHQLLRRRQLAEHQEVGGLLVAVAVLLAVRRDEVLDADSTIVELAGNRLLLALVHDVAVDVADRGQPDQDARTVVVAQAALDAELAVKRRVDVVRLPNPLRMVLEPCAVNVSHSHALSGIKPPLYPNPPQCARGPKTLDRPTT